MKKIESFLLVSVTLIMILSCSDGSSGIKIDKMFCNYKQFASGVGTTVNFGWTLLSNERNQSQKAFQIIIADNQKSIEANEANVWDSGKILSDQSVGNLFENINLKPDRYYYWKVKVWNKNDIESDWSSVSKFITALFNVSDWDNAQWISLEEMDDSKVLVPGITTWMKNTENIAVRRAIIPMFRKEIELKNEIESALLFISGLGHYKAYINGNIISDDFLSPGWTNYHKTCLYNTYDVTDAVKNGLNALGIIVGTGFYNINNERYRKLLITYGMPKLIARMHIKYKDGSEKIIISDKDWKAAPSPITYSSMYGGENYDARLEQNGWNEAGFDDSSWQEVLLAKNPGGKLVPETAFPVKKMETYQPIKVVKRGSIDYLIDFGQNASGIVRIKVKGNKGDTIRIIPAEVIHEDYSVNQRWTGSPYYYEYILKGDGIETWEPMFTYYGLRYVEIFGVQPSDYKDDPGRPELLDIKMFHTYNSTPHTGNFWCSNPLFNQIDTLIRYGIQSNFQSILTDCPHRERLGWLEQSYLVGTSVQHNYEVYHLYCKLVRDMIDSQRKNGLIASTAPEFVAFDDPFLDIPEWGSAIVLLPWLIYKWYGDISLMIEAWPAMQDYMEYLDSKADNFILDYGLGDWYDIGPELPGVSQLTPIPATATSIYFYDYMVLSEMAKKLGKDNESEIYLKKAIKIKEAYNKLLFDPKTCIYSTGSQTSQAIPLSMNIIEEQYREKALQNLVDTIIANNKAITAGDIGFHYLVDALTEGGYSQLFYEMNNRDDVPGYGYQIKKGATALTESWQALVRKSNNHMMLGHIEEWFYTGLGGIRQEENSVAYKNILIDPTFVDGLEQVKTSYYSPYGLIKSEWENRGDELIIEVSVPVNVTARLILPVDNTNNVRENGVTIDEISEIKVLKSDNNKTELEIGSGDYSFLIKK